MTPLSCIACMTICCSVHKSALTYKKIIFSTFSNQQVLCTCICLISCTESETYAHVGLRDGGPIFRAPPCICKLNYFNALCNIFFKEHLPVDGHNRWPKHVADYALYDTINLRIGICTCFVSHNESSVHGHESFKI